MRNLLDEFKDDIKIVSLYEFIRVIVQLVTELHPFSNTFIKTFIEFVIEDEYMKNSNFIHLMEPNEMVFCTIAEKLYQHVKEFRPMFLLDQYEMRMFEEQKDFGESDEIIIFRKLIEHVINITTQKEKAPLVDKKYQLHQIFLKQYVESEDMDLWVKFIKLIMIFESCESLPVLKMAVKNFQCSEKLWLMWADACEDSQEIIDKALITFADNGLEMNPKKWIEEGIELAKNNEYLYVDIYNGYKNLKLIIKSLLPLIDYDTKKKYFGENEYYKLFLSLDVLRAFPRNKRCWVYVLFTSFKLNLNPRYLYSNFFEMVNSNSLNDFSILRHLILAKRDWIEKRFEAAQRHFDFVNADTEWKRCIAEQYNRFQAEYEELKTERLQRLLTLIKSKPKNESTRGASTKEFEKFLTVNERSIHDFLAKVWIQGEHKGVYQALKIFCATNPTDVQLWTMKIQIEVYKNHKNGLKQAIKNIERALSAKSIESSHSGVFLFLAELEKLRGNFSKAREALLKRKTLLQSSSSH